MRAALKKILPDFLLTLWRNTNSRQRMKLVEKERSKGNILTEDRFRSFLMEKGIRSGDTLMLHSSLTSLGYVEGGPEMLIRVLQQVLGESGTLVMPSFPGTGFNFDYLNSGPEFNVLETPSKMGKITEVFRKMKGVKRSLHPTDPVLAWGAQSDFLVSEHFGQITPYNEHSPFYKLTLLNAWILLVGVDLNSLTNLHTLEDAVKDFRFPVYHSNTFDAVIIDESGKRSKMTTKVHDPQWSKKRKCNELIPLFINEGCLKEYQLGKTNVISIRAKAMHECMLKAYSEKGITMYTPHGN